MPLRIDIGVHNMEPKRNKLKISIFFFNYSQKLQIIKSRTKMDVIKASLINEIQIRKEYMNVINQLKITYTVITNMESTYISKNRMENTKLKIIKLINEVLYSRNQSDD